MIDQRRRFGLADDRAQRPPAHHGVHASAACAPASSSTRVSEVLRIPRSAIAPRAGHRHRRAGRHHRMWPTSGGAAHDPYARRRQAAGNRRGWADAGRCVIAAARRDITQCLHEIHRSAVTDQASGRRRLGPDAASRPGRCSRSAAGSRSARPATARMRWSRSPPVRSRRRHARHQHAGDGRPDLPVADHGRAPHAGGDGVVADRPKGALATLEALQLGAVDYIAKPGGTVSLNIDEIAARSCAKVRAAARARVEPRAAALRAAPRRRAPQAPRHAGARRRAASSARSAAWC